MKNTLNLPINLFLMDFRCRGLLHRYQRMIVRDRYILRQLILQASLLCLMWQLVRINKDYVKLTKSSMVSRPITIAYAYRLWCHIGGGASGESVWNSVIFATYHLNLLAGFEFSELTFSKILKFKFQWKFFSCRVRCATIICKIWRVAFKYCRHGLYVWVFWPNGSALDSTTNSIAFQNLTSDSWF